MTLTNQRTEDAEYLIYKLCPHKIDPSRTFPKTSEVLVMEMYNNSIDTMIFDLLKEWVYVLKTPFMQAVRSDAIFSETTASEEVFLVFIWLIKGLKPNEHFLKYEHLALMVPFVFGMAEHSNPSIREYGIESLSEGMCKVFRTSLIQQMSLDTLIFKIIENNLLIHQKNLMLGKESLLLFTSFFSSSSMNNNNNSINNNNSTFNRYLTILDILIKNIILLENSSLIEEYLKGIVSFTHILGIGISIRISLILDSLIELGIRGSTFNALLNEHIIELLDELENSTPILAIKYEEKFSTIRKYIINKS